ncbi:MAG: CDP-alcohol phosphatidyltransferase family protein [Gammaproteobacteria bacterium]|nr:CDP-alcohol phosphatidyltransferase family protein [Gammaproteobacteria bacterium]
MANYSYKEIIKKGLLTERLIYFKLLSYYIAPPLVYLSYKLNISANMVTLFGVFLAIPMVFFNLSHHYFIAAIFLNLFFVCDSIDGILARGTSTQSVLGMYLDELSHYIVHAIFVLSFALSFKANTLLSVVSLIYVVFMTIERANIDLLYKARTLLGGNGKDSDGGKDSIKSMLLRAFCFPNFVVWFSILLWDMRFLTIYISLCALLAVTHVFYGLLKHRKEFARSGNE